MFLPRAFEGSVRIEPASLGSEGLVEVCDSQFYSYRAYYSDLGEVYFDVLRWVYSPSGEGTVGLVVSVSQEEDRVGD